MGEWRPGVLGDLVELKRGYDLPQKRRQTGPFPLVSSSGITDHHAEAMVKGPGVVTGRYGTLGQVFFVEADFWPLNTTLYVRDFRKNDPRFVSYFLRSLDFMAYSDKAAVPGLNRNHLHVAPICYPTNLDEQQNISSLLGALDDKIDLNRQTNETLEALARVIFKDWFVDFGPTRAKAEGRPPYLAQELWDRFPDALDDEGKPVGWGRCALQDLVELNPREPLKRGAEAPYLDMAALPTSGSICAPAVSRAFSSGTRFRIGDTLLARITPCLENGKTAFVQSLPAGRVGWGSTEFIVLRARSPVPLAWTYLLARDPTFRAHAIQSMTGTSGRQRVRTEALAAYPLVNPDAAIWRAFGDLIGPIFDRIKATGEESDTLAQTRDLLLPKLMSGEIRLREAEKCVEAVL